MAKKRPKRVAFDLKRPTEARVGDFDELFSAEGDAVQPTQLVLRNISLAAIQPDPSQPRSTFHDESLQELADSIRQDGLIQPIEVVQIERNQFRIVHGERRWRASQLAERDTIPAIVRRVDFGDVDRYVRQLVENMQREDLNDVDRAIGLHRLRDLMQSELGSSQAADSRPWSTTVSWAKVGERLGLSRQRVHQLVRLLDLPQPILDAIRSSEMSEREARIYHKLTHEQQLGLLNAQRAGSITAADAKAIAQLLKADETLSLQQAISNLRQPAAEQNRTIKTLHDAVGKLSKLSLGRLDSAEIAPIANLIDDLSGEVNRLIAELNQNLD